MARTLTTTSTFVTIPGTDIEIKLEFNTQEDESSMLFHKAGNRVLLGYLMHDSDCRDPSEDEGNGKIYSSSRRASVDQRRKFQEALGLDEDFMPNFYPINEEELAKRLETSLSHPDHDKLALWHEGRINGTIGNKYAIPLDVYEHGQISYSVLGEGMQDQFDTAKGGAVWVPDECAIENFEDKSLTHAENFLKARDYARSCVEEYTNWCNGECYGYVIQEANLETEWSETKESVCGFIGHEYAEKEMKEAFDLEKANWPEVIEAPALDIDKLLFKKENGIPHERAQGERKVVANLIHYLDKKGFKVIAVYDGEESEKVSDMKSAMELIFNLDESHLLVKKETFGRHIITLVLGNSPEEVIADHGFYADDRDGFQEVMNGFNAEEYL